MVFCDITILIIVRVFSDYANMLVKKVKIQDVSIDNQSESVILRK